jgi:ATP-binding cassette subfamily F protein 3
MIRVENLSFAFPAKDLLKNVSFTLESGVHCALIGSNGTGKSTLVEMILDPEKYLYDGKILIDDACRFGYVNQFAIREKNQDCTVFEYLSERFVQNQLETAAVCDEMATAEDVTELFEKYQLLLDQYEAMGGDQYEGNIHKQLYVAGMRDLKDTLLSQLSGGEYKLLQIMREMLVQPNLLIMDEPDVFLDFGNLNRLCKLVQSYQGTLLVITHNRYLLNHCFNKILHLENADIQEFDGNYTEYRCSLMREKLEMELQNAKEAEEIARNEKMVAELRRKATIMDNASLGRAVHAKQSQLDRLKARQIKRPFIDIQEPNIQLPTWEAPVDVLADETLAATDEILATADGALDAATTPVLTITDYQVSFDRDLLTNVSFELMPGEKVAIVGENGTGKTTLIRDILSNRHPAIHIDENTSYACLSQIQNETLDQSKSVYEVMEDAGFVTMGAAAEYLANYCITGDTLKQKVGQLSGGEQNLLQIALIAASDAQLLLLDEPTSHLDLYAQNALEKALAQYKGAVLMVSHDFYLVSNCADYCLLVENNTVRRMRTRSFRKMVYEKYFDQKYLEIDKQKQDLEAGITTAFKKQDLATVAKYCDRLEALSSGNL